MQKRTSKSHRAQAENDDQAHETVVHFEDAMNVEVLLKTMLFDVAESEVPNRIRFLI